MKPSRFDLERPRDLETAISLLAQAAGEAKVLAGGQSLGPMLNLRLAEPRLVIDISGISELRRTERDDDAITLGACITHADIEDGRVADVGPAIMARVASAIAYRAVRNRGTIGGSLSHADPAADWVSCLSALSAEIEVAGPSGRRRTSMADFITGALSTTLAENEVLVSIRVPLVAPTAAFGYVKHCRKTGEFADAIGVALVDPSRGKVRLIVGAVDAAPIIVEDAALFGGRLRSSFAADFDLAAADAALEAAGIGEVADRRVRVEILRRAVLQASARLDPASRIAA